jgi:hypothetical protein
MNTNKQQSLDAEGIATNIFEMVDLEFSKRICDIQAKNDILKLSDDTEDKPIVKISLNSLYDNQF